MSEGVESALKVSKYNSAVAQLQRLDQLWNKAHTASSSGNYIVWNLTLDKIWSELAGDLDQNPTKEKEFYTFTENLGKTGSISKPEIKGFKIEENKERAKQYLILLTKEIWLRRLQNTLGKGSSYDDGSQDDWE